MRTRSPLWKVETLRTGVPMLRRAGMLASICARADALAVAGTHGKTTTTSMLAMMLVGAGLDPGFIIGGDVHQVGSGARWGSGRFLVVEADRVRGDLAGSGELESLRYIGIDDALAQNLATITRDVVLNLRAFLDMSTDQRTARTQVPINHRNIWRME